jgi:hypothetical protein
MQGVCLQRKHPKKQFFGFRSEPAPREGRADLFSQRNQKTGGLTWLKQIQHGKEE